MEQQLRSWLRVCELFGIYVSSNNKNSTKTPIYLQHCYIFILHCGICFLYVRGIYLHYYPPGLEFTWTFTAVLFTSRYITNTLIFIEAIWSKCEHEKFLLLLQELENSLSSRLRCDVHANRLLKYIQRFVAYQSVLSILGLAPFMLSTIWVHYSGYFWDAFWSICTMRIRTLQLLVYLHVLRHYMTCLCGKLSQIVAYRMTPNRQLLVVDRGKLGTLEYLVAVQELYMKLVKAFQLLNVFGGWSLFGIVTSYMFDLSANFYWLLQSLDDDALYYKAFSGIPWLIPIAVFTWYLCYLSNDCKRLAQTMSHLLRKIIISSSLPSLAHYRLLLQQFSVQLQIQRIEVSARSFFVLDMRFIMSVFAAIAMVLVILLQF